MTEAMKQLKKLPSEIAVAIRYDSASMRAPAISGAGGHHQARAIIQLARRYGIPLAEDMLLASQLYALPDEAEIPAELYSEIAALLAELARG